MVEGVSEYHLAREHASRKRKAQRSAEARRVKKGQKVSLEHAMPVDTAEAGPSQPAGEVSSSDAARRAPAILRHISVGINEVTKRLEHQARSHREIISVSENHSDTSQSRTAISVVFVCLSDVDPPNLIAHLPQLIAACNSHSNSGSSTNRRPTIKLVTLPKQAEFTLAAAMGLRRVTTIAIDVCSAFNTRSAFSPRKYRQAAAPCLSDLETVIDCVPLLNAPWIILPDPASRRLEPTHIKQLRTTAPKDMKAAKELRAKGRAAAKERKKRRRHEPGGMSKGSKRIKISTASV